jgi:ABC-2 type transport system permease protein
MREVRILVRKELLQLVGSRGALWTTVLLPILFLLLAPAPYLLLASVLPLEAIQAVPMLSLGGSAGGPSAVVRALVLPLCLLAGGLLVPSSTATYTLIAEREQRTLELLVALPVRIGQVLLAKVLVVAMVTIGVCAALFGVDAALIMGLKIAGPGYVAALGTLLLAALVFATASALLIALLARDLRTANHLATAFLFPTMLGGAAVLVAVPGEIARLLVLAALLLVGAATALWVALRVVTFERLLR